MSGEFLFDSVADSGTNPITLQPEWSFQQNQTAIRTQHRSQGGELQVWDWSNYLAFSVPLQFVDSADATRINSWWQAGDPVALTLNSSEANSTVIARIVNQQLPLNQFHRPNQNLWQGTLFLEALNGGDVGFQDSPFVLDDDVMGLLDQSYNSLV